WVRQNPKARQAKSKARLERYEELASREFQERNETNEIYIPPGERLGDLVIEVERLRKGYGERLLIDNLSFRMPRGAIVGIIGPNGAGKTTLFRMLTGGGPPDAGTIRLGESVHLAKVLHAGGNVLLLDEPTNDLDIETLRALEEALLGFPGCAVVISHDRWFLDRIATHILAFEGDSQVVWFEGNYREYVEDFRRRRGEDAAQPHRIRYKPLTR